MMSKLKLPQNHNLSPLTVIFQKILQQQQQQQQHFLLTQIIYKAMIHEYTEYKILKIE